MALWFSRLSIAVGVWVTVRRLHCGGHRAVRLSVGVRFSASACAQPVLRLRWLDGAEASRAAAAAAAGGWGCFLVLPCGAGRGGEVVYSLRGKN